MEAHKIINIHTRFSMTENDTSIFNSLNLDLSVLFQKVKVLLFAEAENKNQCENKSLSVRSIMKLITKKLNEKWVGNTKEFIGMFVIFIYIVRFQQTYFHSLNFHSNFFINLNLILQKSYYQLLNEQNHGQDQKAFTNFATLLFSLANFCEILEKVEDKKNLLKKFLNPLFMETFLKLNLPDNQKILSYYRILLLQIIKRRTQLYNKVLLIQSASKHFLISSTSNETKVVCLYALSISYKCTQSHQKLFDDIKVQQILQHLRKIVFKPERKQTFSLSLILASNILKNKNQKFVDYFLTLEEFLSLIALKQKFEFTQTDIQAIISLTKLFNEKKLLSFMSELILLIGEYGIALKIIYEMIPLLTPYIILQVLELNLLEKLHETLKSQTEKTVLLSIQCLQRILQKSTHFAAHIDLMVQERIRQCTKNISGSINHLRLSFCILQQMLSHSEQLRQQTCIF